MHSFDISQTNAWPLIQTLTKLNLSGNLIKDRGAEFVSNALQANKVRKIFLLYILNWCSSFHVDTHYSRTLLESDWK
jgi:hypothetical protein